MKSGWRTTEFWVSILSVLLPSIAGALHATGDPRLVVAGVAVGGLYTVGRSAVKAAGELAASRVAVAETLAPFGAMTEAERTAAAKATATAPVNPLMHPGAH